MNNNQFNYYTNQRDNTAKRLSSQRSAYGNIAAGGQSLYNSVNPQYQSAVQRVSQRLQQDPYTDSYSAAKLAKATSGTERDYQSARANLASDMARRGLAPSSGAGVGGFSAIEAARAGAMAQARGNLAYQQIAERDARDQALLQLLGGARQEGLQQEMGGYGKQDALDQYLGQYYGGIVSEEEARREAARARRNATMNALIGGVSGMGGQFLGSYFNKT